MTSYINQAYFRGVASGRTTLKERADTTDVAELIAQVQEEQFPLASMPSQRDDWNAFVEWEIGGKVVAAQIGDAYMAGVHGDPIPTHDYAELRAHLLEEAHRTGLMAS